MIKVEKYHMINEITKNTQHKSIIIYLLITLFHIGMKS